MAQYQSFEQVHARVCSTRNIWSALFFVAFCALEAFLSWRGLGKAYPERSFYGRLFDYFGYVATIAICARLLMIFRCFQERFVLGLLIAVFVRVLVAESMPALFIPSVFNRVPHLVGQVFFMLWVVALLISIFTLVSRKTERPASH
jgi:hypothetical protein